MNYELLIKKLYELDYLYIDKPGFRSALTEIEGINNYERSIEIATTVGTFSIDKLKVLTITETDEMIFVSMKEDFINFEII